LLVPTERELVVDHVELSGKPELLEPRELV
jgi:hypothetical protein